jgi:hypothetical protein
VRSFLEKKRKKGRTQSKFESFFKIRKKTSKAGKIIKSKKDKEKEKRIKHRDLMKEDEE